MTLSMLLLGLFPALVIAAAAYDAATFTIPNWISAALVLAFLPVALICGLSPMAIGLCLLTGAGVLALGAGAFAAGWLGGGDAKLMAATALWLGWPAVVNFVLVTALTGGALAVLLIGLRARGLSVLLSRGPAWMNRMLAQDGGAPYGLAIATGALVAFPASKLVLAAQGVAG